MIFDNLQRRFTFANRLFSCSIFNFKKLHKYGLDPMIVCKTMLSRLNAISIIRAFAAMQLNSYITILATPKHKKESCNSRVKPKNFSFSTTVQMCMVAQRLKKIKLLFYVAFTLNRNILIIFFSFLFFSPLFHFCLLLLSTQSSHFVSVRCR